MPAPRSSETVTHRCVLAPPRRSANAACLTAQHSPRRTWCLVLAAVLPALAGPAARAQVRFWDTLTDGVSGTVCDVVNTENAQLLIRTDTGQLQILNAGRDVILADPVVTAEGDVVINGESVGFIDFQSDADGNRVVWWTSLLGQVVRIDEFTGEPSATTRLPGDFRNAPCDVCDAEELLDDASFCDDGNSDEPPITVRLCGRNVVVSMVGSLTMLGFAALRRRRKLQSGVRP